MAQETAKKTDAAPDNGLRVVLPSFNVIGQFGADKGVIFKAGDVLDTSDPFTASMVKGQEYKLGPAPAGKAASEMRDGRARGAREAWMRQNGRSKPEKSKQEQAVERAAPKVEGIQTPDASTRKTVQAK